MSSFKSSTRIPKEILYARKQSLQPQGKGQPGLRIANDAQPKADDPQLSLEVEVANKVALITGGDSGIGRSAVAIAYAKKELMAIVP